MLLSVLKQKVALAAYATEKSNVTVLTPYQLEVAQKVVEALEPIEEITKSISSYSATIAIVIPLIRMLIEKYRSKDYEKRNVTRYKEEI